MVNANANGKLPEEKQNKVMLIRAQDAQSILNYLAGQPCGQVYNLVGVLLQLQEAPAECQPGFVPPRQREAVDADVAAPR